MIACVLDFSAWNIFVRLSIQYCFKTDDDSHKAQVYYAKVPPDVDRRTVLLMYPILTHGITVIEAIKGNS